MYTPTVKLDSLLDDEATIKLPKIIVRNKYKRPKAAVQRAKHNGTDTFSSPKTPDLLPLDLADLKDESQPSTTEIHQN